MYAELQQLHHQLPVVLISAVHQIGKVVKVYFQFSPQKKKHPARSLNPKKS